MCAAWVQCRNRWSRWCLRDERRERDERSWWPGLDVRGSERGGERRRGARRGRGRHGIEQRGCVSWKQQRWGDGN
jgi:hypothetical protein